MKLNIIISIVFFYCNLAFCQKLPINQRTGEVVYTDMIVLDTLNADTAFKEMLLDVKSYENYCRNIHVDSSKLTIKYTFVTSVHKESFGDVFGEVHATVVIKYFPNKFSYFITNFRHVPVDDYPPCKTNLNLNRPRCFIGKPFEKYWEEVKKEALWSMNDFILRLIYVTLRNQPTKELLKVNNYFLLRNR